MKMSDKDQLRLAKKVLTRISRDNKDSGRDLRGLAYLTLSRMRGELPPEGTEWEKRWKRDAERGLRDGFGGCECRRRWKEEGCPME